MAATTNTPVLYATAVQKKPGDFTAWRAKTTWRWTNLADGSPGEYTFEMALPADGLLDQAFWDDNWAKLVTDANTYYDAIIEGTDPIVLAP